MISEDDLTTSMLQFFGDDVLIGELPSETIWRENEDGF